MHTGNKVIIYKLRGEVISSRARHNLMCFCSLFKIYIQIFKQKFMVFKPNILCKLFIADATIFLERFQFFGGGNKIIIKNALKSSQ